jgi:hypothetical protein
MLYEDAQVESNRVAQFDSNIDNYQKARDEMKNE